MKINKICLTFIFLNLFFNFSAFKIIYCSENTSTVSIKVYEQLNDKIRINNKETIITPKNLDDFLKLAISRSGKILIAKEEYKLSLTNFKNIRRDLFPKMDLKYEEIDGTTTGEDFTGKGYKLELSHPLYSGGKLINQYKQSKVNLEVSKLKHDQIIWEIINSTEKAYYIYLESLRRLKEIENITSTYNEATELLKRLHQQGLARDIDFLESTILTKEFNQKVTEAKNDLLLSEVSLKQIIDYYQGELAFDSDDIKYSEIKIDSNRIIDIALQNRIDIKLHSLIEQVNQYNKNIAKADSKLRISLDGYTGKRAENFVTERLEYDNEYYVGVTGSLPLGKNTLESQFIDQDTVPSAGQTTSTQFSSYNVKLNLLDNKNKSTKTDGLIKYYKSIEETEKIKKSAIFEIIKMLSEVAKTFEQVKINEEKNELAIKKLEFQKIKLSKNETSINEYLKEIISLMESKKNLSKSLSGYFSAVSDLNLAIGMPCYFNPQDGTSENKKMNELIPENTNEDSSWIKKLFNGNNNDTYYPEENYEDFRTSIKN